MITFNDIILSHIISSTKYRLFAAFYILTKLIPNLHLTHFRRLYNFYLLVVIMQPVAIPLILLGYLLASVASTQFQPFSDSTDSLISNSNPQQQLQPQQQQQNQLSHFPFPKRASERYGFGLGRRAFTYTSGNSGVKRLPVYNFGLGKRSDGNGGDGGAYAGEKR